MKVVLEPVDIVKETTTHFAEHEVLLSFTNDSGAEKFEDWWSREGVKLFNNFCEENKNFYDY